MESIISVYGGEMKINITNLPNYRDLSDEFQFEVGVLVKHLRCVRHDIEIRDDWCGDYFILYKGNYWGYISDVDYLMEGING